MGSAGSQVSDLLWLSAGLGEKEEGELGKEEGTSDRRRELRRGGQFPCFLYHLAFSYSFPFGFTALLIMVMVYWYANLDNNRRGLLNICKKWMWGQWGCHVKRAILWGRYGYNQGNTEGTSKTLSIQMLLKDEVRCPVSHWGHSQICYHNSSLGPLSFSQWGFFFHSSIFSTEGNCPIYTIVL